LYSAPLIAQHRPEATYLTVSAFAALSAREALSLFQHEPPDLQPHETEIRIIHCGVCPSDIHLIDND
jgi:uncharacterized zinc-type alcohol dehydrogenase-like protein